MKEIKEFKEFKAFKEFKELFLKGPRGSFLGPGPGTGRRGDLERNREK